MMTVASAVRRWSVGPGAGRAWAGVGLVWMLGVGLGVGVGCNYPVQSIYACATDEDCIEKGADGRCESNSFCTFPDAGCPEGRRWHDRAAEDLAGQCFEAADLEPTTGASSGGASGPGTTAADGSTTAAPGSDGTTAAGTGASTG